MTKKTEKGTLNVLEEISYTSNLSSNNTRLCCFLFVFVDI